MKQLLIIGGGVAAAESALAARAQDPESRIVVLSEESVPPYRRPALSGLVGDAAVDLDKLLLHPAEFYAQRKIALHLNVRVERIDPERHCAISSDGRRFDYDRLIVATGSRANRPPIPGAELPVAMAFRSYADLLELRSRLDSGVRRAAVIGAGLLGLELAEALLRRNCQVELLDHQDRLLSRSIDASGSAFLLRRLEQINGLKIHLSSRVQAIEPDRVRLADRDDLPVDLVVFSAGSRPEAPVLPGMEDGKRLPVDNELKTAWPDVFAAGDVAEGPWFNPGLYLPARDMGRAAGTIAMGGKADCAWGAFPVRLAAFGVKLFAYGAVDEAIGSPAQTTDADFVREFRRSDGRLAGVVLIGNVSAAATYQREIDAAGASR